MSHILAIDDDEQILQLIKTALQRDGHIVETANTPQSISIKKAQFSDLILLDIMMPQEDGFSYCTRIRHLVDCPILFITARSNENDVLHGLGIGADDYITKPFSIAVLRAKVNAHLRRESRPHTHIIALPPFTVDYAAKQLLYNNKPIILTKSQYLICAFLIESAGQVFSKEQIYEALFFDKNRDSDTSIVVEHIKNIRKKLLSLGENPIKTVWGIGYSWEKSAH